MKVISFGQLGVLVGAELGEPLESLLLGALDDLPDPPHDHPQEVEVAVLGRDDPLPVPLVDVAAVVVVEEVVLADGPHVGQEALADPVAELLERRALPLGGGLHDLGVDRVLVVVVGDVELDRPALAVAVEHVVDARLDVDDERNLDHVQVQLLAEIALDVVLDYVDGLLGLPAVERRCVVVRQDLLEVLVVADARPGKIGLLVARRERHGSAFLSMAGPGASRGGRWPPLRGSRGQSARLALWTDHIWA